MCWNTSKFRNRLPRIAANDIAVVKFAAIKHRGVDLAIPYYIDCDIVYKVGESYKAKLETPLWPLKKRETGLHCYNPDMFNVTVGLGYVIVTTNDEKSGDYIASYNKDRCCVMHCFIPNGALYFENEFGEIVTNKLVVVSIQSFDEFIDSLGNNE